MDTTRNLRWKQKMRCSATTLGQIERERIEEERCKERKIESAVNKAGLKAQIEFLVREFSGTEFLACLQDDVFTRWERFPNRTAIFAYCDVLQIAEDYGMRDAVMAIKDKMVAEAKEAMDKKKKRIDIILTLMDQG